MLNIDSIENGIVIDHITAGLGMRIYELLELDKLDTCVAIIKNAKSEKYGKKDIIKIEGVMNIDLDVLGFIDDNATVCTIVNGKLQSKKKPPLPQRLVNIVSCKNPRCITSVEDVDQVFTLCDEKAHRYRCIYCEQGEEARGYPAGQPRLFRGGQAVREETPPPGQRGQAAAGLCHPVQRGAVPGPGGAEPAGDHPGGAGPAGG